MAKKKTLKNGLLTDMQKKFCDNYLISGNGSQAAREAGYSCKRVNTQACKLLAQDNIKQYLAKKVARIESKKIAKAEEVLEFLTAVMRGQIRDAFDLDPSLDDRLDAAKQLQKRYGMDKVALVGGEKDDKPLTVESVQIYLPDNNR